MNNDKPKTIVDVYKEFKADMANTINKYINELPAVFITDYLNLTASQFSALEQTQLVEVTKEESEVKSNE